MPGRAKRRLRLAGARRAQFLALLARDANLAAAARAALVHVATVYRTAEREPGFAAETAAALADAYDALDAASAAGRAERGARLMAALDSPSWAADGSPPPLPDFETVMRRLDRYTRPPPRPLGPRREARPHGTFDEILAKLEERLARVFGTSEDRAGIRRRASVCAACETGGVVGTRRPPVRLRAARIGERAERLAAAAGGCESAGME